jgi:FtsZ-binding cell division protein ZapB
MAREQGFLTVSADAVLVCSGAADIRKIAEFEQLLEGQRVGEAKVVEWAISAAEGIIKYAASVDQKRRGTHIEDEILGIVTSKVSEWDRAQDICALCLRIYSREERDGSPGPLYIEINRRLRTIPVIARRDWASAAAALESACGELAPFAHLVWYGLRTGFKLSPPTGETMWVYRGVVLPPGALRAYRECVGKFIAWGSFASFSTSRSVATRFAQAPRGQAGVVFELKTAGRPRIKSLSAHRDEEELLLHPFSTLQVDAVEGEVVKLTEVAAVILRRPLTDYHLAMVPPVDTAAEKRQLKESLEQLRAELDEVGAKVAGLEADNARLKTGTAKPKGRIGDGDLHAENRRLQWEIWSLKGEIATLSDERRALDARLGALTAEVSRLKAPPRAGGAPAPAVVGAPAKRASVEQVIPGVGTLGELTMFKTENSALKAENSALKAENSALRAENSALRARNSALKSQNATIDQVIPGSFASAFSQVLTGWLGATSPLELLWKSSKPRDARGFHRTCDGKANMLVIVQSKEGNIFGGFAVPAWDSSNKWKDDPTGLTFLFVLKNTFDDPPTRFRKKGPAQAIECRAECGPIFGGDGGVAEMALWWHGGCSVNVSGRYCDELGRGTAAFVSSGSGRQVFDMDSYEVWAATGPPTPCVAGGESSCWLC